VRPENSSAGVEGTQGVDFSTGLTPEVIGNSLIAAPTLQCEDEHRRLPDGSESRDY
jgi:hypothetical protein